MQNNPSPQTLPVFALIHSPIVGPGSWIPAARALKQRGLESIVPRLPYDPDPPQPFWRLHAQAAAGALAALPPDRHLFLAGHSGAGLLLPAICQLSRRPAAGYIFVDSSFPDDGKSRLDHLKVELPEVAGPLYEALAAGKRLPQWSDSDLSEDLPDAALRAEVLNDLRPHPLAFMTEPIPVFQGWPDAPCAYLRFGSNSSYESPSQRARQAGWAYRQLKGGHFHLLVQPETVAQALIDLASEMQPG